MPLYLHDNQSLLFLHIPKTGGTTIENWLNSTKNYQELFLAQNRLPDTKVTPQHFGYQSLHQLMGDINEQNMLKFAIVRNPYHRLVSEFFYRIKLRELDLGKAPEQYFSAWLCDMLKQAKDCPELLDNHLQTQTYFCAEDVHVYKFEDGINNIVIELANKLNLAEPTDITAKKVGVKKDVLWSKKAISAVNAFYAKDFSSFSYELTPAPQHSLMMRTQLKFRSIGYYLIQQKEVCKNKLRKALNL